MANEIINLRRAGRGTDGTTSMPGAARARLLGNLSKKTSQAGGGDMPAGAWKTGGAPQVVIEFEGLADAIAAIKGTLDNQTLVLGFVGSSGNRKYTIKWCTATAVGESQFPPAEDDGSAVRHQVTFDVHQGTGVTTLAQAMVEAADVGDPSGTINPIVMIQAVYRGASGTNAIGKAVRATLQCEMAKKASRAGGSELPDRVWVTGRRPQVLIESEDTSIYLSAITAGVTDEIVKIHYQSASGDRILTARVARLLGVNELALEPAEQSGQVSRAQMVWDLVLGTGVTSIDDALSDAAA